MPKQIIIAEQHQIAAVFWEEQIQELVVSTGTQQVSDIYLGSVENVIPGIDAAFVNIGDSERNGFIHVTDLGPLRLKRSAASITELLVPQQKALVQVMKEPTGNKGPRLTGNVTLPGRYLVLMPYGKGVKLSRRIREEQERSRLRALAILIKPAGMGLLVRTEADGQPEEAIMEDLENLQKQWESIQERANHARPPVLLNRDDDFIQRVLRDMYSGDVNTIVVDSQVAMKRVKQHLVGWSGGRSPQGVFVDYHKQQQPILEYYRVNAAIREALKPRVELPSGGYIIIEPTEALTVIDVNSGSFTRSATARETVLWTNREAATEIARQLRLRNIGGVIVVDFIDMDTHVDRLKLLEHFNNALRSDKARPQIAQLSELGLVELTRKRQGQNIYELFGHSCPTCGGLGHLAALPGRNQAESLEGTPVTPLTINNNSIDTQDRRAADFSSNRELASNNLQLDNHPNYQEQTKSNSRSRPRRKDIALKEEINDPESNISYPKEEERSRNGNAKSNDSSERQDRNSNENDLSLRDREATLRDRKSRSSNRNRREEPVEKVSVELNDLEQEIYALMGISPLVRVEREFKNPKAVVVKVRKPGEAEEADTENTPQEPEAVGEVEETSSNGEVENKPQEAEAEKVEETPSNSEPELDTSEEESGVDDGRRRRRRRRSSTKKEVTV